MTRGAEDGELLRRARDGDDGALAVLMDRYQALLTRHAARQLPAALRPRVSVADVVQEARIVAHQRHGEFEHRGQGSFRNWLLRIVDLKVKEAVRAHLGTAKRAVSREAPPQTGVRTAHFVSGQPTPSEVAVGGEVEDLARRTLDSLPADYQQVLRLAQQQGLTLREVAQCMGRSRDAVKRLYGRALSRFAKAFRERGGSAHG